MVLDKGWLTDFPSSDHEKLSFLGMVIIAMVLDDNMDDNMGAAFGSAAANGVEAVQISITVENATPALLDALQGASLHIKF